MNNCAEFVPLQVISPSFLSREYFHLNCLVFPYNQGSKTLFSPWLLQVLDKNNVLEYFFPLLRQISKCLLSVIISLSRLEFAGSDFSLSAAALFVFFFNFFATCNYFTFLSVLKESIPPGTLKSVVSIVFTTHHTGLFRPTNIHTLNTHTHSYTRLRPLSMFIEIHYPVAVLRIQIRIRIQELPESGSVFRI